MEIKEPEVQTPEPKGNIIGEFTLDTGSKFDVATSTSKVEIKEEVKEEVVKEELTPKKEISITKEDTPKKIEKFDDSTKQFFEGKSSKEGKVEKNEENQETQVSKIKVLFEELRDKGIIDLPEEFKGESDEEIVKVWQDNLDKKGVETFESRFKNHPQRDKAEALFKYIENGGDIDRFTEAYANPLAFVDKTNEKDQERLVTMLYKATTKLSDDKIQAKIKRAKDTATLAEEASDAYDVLEGIRKENEEITLKEAAITKQQEDKERSDTINEIKEFINKNENIKGVIDIKDKKAKKTLEDYMFKPVVKYEGRLITKAEHDDINESLEDYLTIKALKAQGFDFSKLLKSIDTKVKTSLVEKLNDVGKERARIEASGRVPEQEIMTGASLTREQKDKLWNNLLLG